MITLENYLLVGAILFCFGLFNIFTRRNSICMLMGVELVLNAANINLVAFGRFTTHALDSQVFAIFVVILAACEAAVALAIILVLYEQRNTIDSNMIDRLKG